MRKFIVLCLVAVLISGSVAFAAVEKVKVRKIDVLKVQNVPEVRVELEVQGSGTIFVQASTDYDKYTYVTEPVTLEVSSPQPFFVLRFTKGDFRRVNLLENLNEEIPEFAEGKNVVVYVYEAKYTSSEGQPEDIKQDIAKYGYALRGVLAKGTKEIQLARK
ncbi:hypothetical protein ACP6EK_01635 [Candidatus Caldatribacterium sp. SIUC1]|uniref:hypothetical protein n=1 Tax=Candidatus Caldatribacterium sp. SIUC1 TaxID=3418365 RepID=UPI003F68C02A